ncbi:hypothetical protein CHS0354_029850 [Potamilus streckersoni]|nr:hypothetical protein CHS0354_029850 [Potamilus streckersoni]
MKQNWEKMISNTTDLPISQPLIGNSEQVVQRRPSKNKKDKSDSHKLESYGKNGNEKHHLSGPYDKPWSSYLSVISGPEVPSSSSNRASADMEASNTQQRNAPNDEMSCVSVGWAIDKEKKDDLAGKIEDDGKYSQKTISELRVSNSCSDQTQLNSMAIGRKESPTTEDKDFDKSEPDADIVQMRRSRTIVKVHRDGSVSNVEDADRYSQDPTVKSKSRDVSKLQRQEAIEPHFGSQPKVSEESRGTAESSKDYTSQYVNNKPEAIPVKVPSPRPSFDSKSDLVQKASEVKKTTLITIESNASASLTVNNGKPRTCKVGLLTENAVPLREVKKFKPYALKELKIFLENNFDLVSLNLNVERYSTEKSAMEALKEFLERI